MGKESHLDSFRQCYFLFDYQAVWSTNLFKEGVFIKHLPHLPLTVNAHVIGKAQSMNSMQSSR